jgi:hypothetical protein
MSSAIVKDDLSYEEIRANEYARRMYDFFRGAVRVAAGATYNATDILGYQLLNIGTGTLTLSFKDGGTDIVITAAELTAMGAGAYEERRQHLDSITAGTGMTLMVFI